MGVCACIWVGVRAYGWCVRAYGWVCMHMGGVCVCVCVWGGGRYVCVSVFGYVRVSVCGYVCVYMFGKSLLINFDCDVIVLTKFQWSSSGIIISHTKETASVVALIKSLVHQPRPLSRSLQYK